VTNDDAMETGRLNRRTAVTAFGGAAAAVMLARSRGAAAPAPRATVLDTAAFQSGGIGLGRTRDEWIAEVGEGERIDVELGDDLYEYAVQFGPVYVAFRDFGDVSYAHYIEIGFGGGGLTYDRVEPIVTGMMPADADATDSYLAPATPSGPTAIATWRYVSDSLGSLHPGIPSEFLSMRLQKRGEDNAWLVTSAHLMVGEIMQ
jgi:hypothetical protein